MSLILLLILINGIFALSEMALVSSSKVRLQKLADENRTGADAALKLHEEPSRFLSTVQVGITSVGILSGAMGEGALTEPLKAQLSLMPLLTPYADSLALVLTVVLITYCSVVVGELVPKRLALLNPEGIALFVARPMNGLSIIASPLVWLLSSSSSLILRIMRANQPPQPTITNEEIKILMDMGSESGVFHANEGHLVSNVLRLDEQRVNAIMTTRKDIFIIDLNDENSEVSKLIAESPYSKLVVCRDGLDHVIGVLNRSDLLKALMKGDDADIESVLRSPFYVPNSLTIPHLLEFFRENRCDFALIVNEYGDVDGLVTLTDVLNSIVGDMPTEIDDFDPDVVQRNDGSWLVSGGLSMGGLKEITGIPELAAGDTANLFNTVGGFVLCVMEKIPRVADNFTHNGWYFEVVDIDGTRIDKVLVINKTDINPDSDNSTLSP